MSNIQSMESLVFYEMPGYADVGIRPLTSDVRSSATLTRINEALTGEISNSNIAEVVGDAITYRSEATRASIASGFETRRFCWTARIVTANPGMNSETIELISGYTDHLGVAGDRSSLSEDMRMYPNSLIVLSKTFSVNNRGHLVPQTRIVSNQQILSSVDTSSYRTGVVKTAQRPVDVSTILMTSSRYGLGQSNSNVRIAGNTLNTVLLNNRRHNSPTGWISDLVRELRTVEPEVINSVESGDITDYDSTLYSLMGKRLSPRTSTSAFTRWLTTDQYVLSSWVNHGFFTYSDISNRWQETYAVTEVILSDLRSRNRERSIENMAGWTGSDLETLMAYTVQQTVPALMTEYNVGQISFVATNETMDRNTGLCRTVVTPTSCLPLIQIGSHDDSEMDLLLDYMVRRLETEVFLPLSRFDDIQYAIKCDFDITRQSFIAVSVERQEYIEFSAPLHCDGIYSSNITDSDDELTAFADDIDKIIKTVRSTPSIGIDFDEVRDRVTGTTSRSDRRSDNHHRRSNSDMSHGSGLLSAILGDQYE